MTSHLGMPNSPVLPQSMVHQADKLESNRVSSLRPSLAIQTRQCPVHGVEALQTRRETWCFRSRQRFGSARES